MLAVNVPEIGMGKSKVCNHSHYVPRHSTLYSNVRKRITGCTIHSSSPVLTSTHHSNGSPSETFWLFSGSPLEVRPPTDLHAKWLKQRGLTQGCAFCSKNRNYSYPWCAGSPKAKRSKFGKFFDLENFHSIWPLTLEVQRENTPYTSSEPNESGIVNRQSGGEKLKDILKFCIGGTCHVISLSPERPSAQMSKITNDGLTRSGTGCFIL